MDDQASSILPRAHSRALAFSVVKVREGSKLSVGQVFEVHLERVVIGRDASADVRLNDRTVSRQHVAIVDEGLRLCLENLSERGATFVNRERIAHGQQVRFEPDDVHLQVGGVLLRVRSTAETTAFQSAMSVDDVDGVDAPLAPAADASSPAITPPGAFLDLTWDAGHCHVRMDGRMLSAYPATAAVLAALCATPGEPVHRFDLEEALGDGGNLEQQVSLIRRQFADQIDAGVLSADRIRGFVRTHSTGPHLARLDEMDTRELLRHFIAARRGYGYVLCLGDDDVRIDDGAA